MKKKSILKSVSIIFGGLFLSLGVMQCTKVGINAKKLDRAFIGTADSTLFAPFYDKTTISVADVVPATNDIITVKGVQSTIKEYCGISTCHGGPINPKLSTYSEIKSLAIPGNPEDSKLWELITTNDLNKTMPPVSATHEISLTDKTIIYNWIKNGAKEFPDLIDFRPAAIRVITNGCTSANCHNVATSTGSWARAGLLTLAPPAAPGQPSPDTAMFTHVRGTSISYYCQITNKDTLTNVWNRYKDSVRKYYSDTVGNAIFKPYKTFSTPVVKSSVRGPLSSYDDIIFDIWYPKGLRSNGSNPYTPNVRGDNLNAISISATTGAITTLNYFIARFDSTLLRANPRTGVYSIASSSDGDMAYSDGGITPSEIALIKAWYFADPNIPDVWKYGINNAGIFKYKPPRTTIIIKH
jgi:hypothetical protein